MTSNQPMPERESDRNTAAVVATRPPYPDAEVIAKELEKVLRDNHRLRQELGDLRERLKRAAPSQAGWTCIGEEER